MSQVHASVQPSTLGRYNLIERLGIGGQGEVWRAHDGARGIDVAIKILAPALGRSTTVWAALEREQAICARLRHEAILKIEPPERIDGYTVLPMELAAGGNLSRLCGQGYLAIVPVLLEIAEVLEYVHARGVVHRDIKPGNVLYDDRGRLKLADFGIAALLPGAGAGPADSPAAGLSPFTASPEQLRGEAASPADDIYGLGALAYELLAGQPPHFPRFDPARVQSGPVPELTPTRPTPAELIALVMRMLAKSADERPASMRQVIQELGSILKSTLTLEPTDLVDLVGVPAHAPQPGPAKTPTAAVTREAGQPAAAGATSEPASLEGAPGARSVSASSSAGPLGEASQAVLAASSSGARRIAPPPAPIHTGPEPLRGTIDPIPVIEPTRLAPMHWQGPRGPRAALPRPRAKPHRLRYVLFGLVWGVVIAAGVLRWTSRGQLRGDLDSLSTLVARARGVEPSQSVTGNGLAAQRAKFDRRMSLLAARGAAAWDAADFSAAKTQAAEASGAEEAGGISVARDHWRKAHRLLLAMDGQRRRVLAAKLEAGKAALAAGHDKVAARAFASALRVDPGNEGALEGARQARLLTGVLPLLADARRAEHVRDYARAARDYSRTLARDPGYGPAEAGLARVKSQSDEAFAAAGYAKALRAGLKAFGDGRLYQAQADFQQALVYRPHGTEAAAKLEQVNAALKGRRRSGRR